MAISVRQFNKWSKSHKRRYLKGIGLSEKQFASKSPKGQRKAVRKARTKALRRSKEANDPREVTKRLTPKSLRKETKAAADYEFGPSERELDSQTRISQAHEARIPSWYADYQAQVTGSAKRTADSYAGSQTKWSQNTDKSATDEQAEAQRIADIEIADAAKRGATVDPAIALKNAQARLSSKESRQDFGGLMASEAANSASYYDAAGRTASAWLADELSKERGRANKIGGEKVNLARDRGSFSTKYRSEARKGERDYGLQRSELSLAGKSLGLDKDKAEMDALLEGQKISADADESALDRAIRRDALNETKRSNRAKERISKSKGKGKKTGRITRSQRLKQRDHWDTAKLLVKGRNIEDALAEAEYTGAKIPRMLLELARKQRTRGYLTKREKRKLKMRGIL